MKKVIRIDGMSCGHCVAAVRQALDAQEGVEVIEVEIGRATVETSSSSDARDDAMLAAIRKAGYEPVSTTAG